MIKLHGFNVSNYFNMLKLALLEKGVPYEMVKVYPNQEADFLAKSPMGKVPALETDSGFLSETSVILEYIDSLDSKLKLFPSDAFARAQMQELVKVLELYIELPARRCYPEAFFGGKVSDETKQQSKELLLRGARALADKASFSPYVAGDTLSAADIVFLYSVPLAAGVAQKVLGFDLFAELPGARELMEKLGEREHAKTVAADQATGAAEFQRYIASKA